MIVSRLKRKVLFLCSTARHQRAAMSVTRYKVVHVLPLWLHLYCCFIHMLILSSIRAPCVAERQCVIVCNVLPVCMFCTVTVIADHNLVFLFCFCFCVCTCVT